MNLKYTFYNDEESYGKEGIAIKGLGTEELKNAMKNGIFAETNDHIYVIKKEKPNFFKDEKVILNGEIHTPCELCKHKLKKITEGCRWCDFEYLKPIEQENSSVVNLVEYLKEKGAKEISKRKALDSDNFFSKEHSRYEISLEEEVIEENTRKMKEAAQTAVRTKKFKKEFCSSCVYADENNKCKFTHPTYCNKKFFNTKEDMMVKVLDRIEDVDKFLKLSLICGEVIKYKNVRYRISKVVNEKLELYLLTRDYSPWNTIEISLAEIAKEYPYLEKKVHEETFENNKENERKENAVTLKLIYDNWDNISNIKSWQRQHMFYAKYNKYLKNAEIEIHLSKETFGYRFNSPEELTKTTAYVGI